MKRPRDSSQQDLKFFVFNPIDKHCATFEVSRFGKEANFYVLRFHRPGLKQARLYTFYALDTDDKCVYTTKLEEGEPGETVTLMDRTYKVYETYTLGQDTETTHTLYFQIEGNKVCCDMSLVWLPKNVSQFIRNVRFFPWDVDPTQYGLKLDTEKMIQKTPLWTKARGPVSGTKAYKLVGFWVPSKQKDPNWTLDGDEVFDAQSKANMKFGTESEDKGLITYATHSKNIVKIELAGWCNAPGLVGWGASPDGLVHDPTHTWDDARIPKSTRESFENVFDPTRGVLEIKSSLSKLSFEAYFFPQVYMEMISTQRIWCDLVRYTPSKVRIYRVYRHKATEETLLSLWKYARSNVQKLRDIIQEEPFVKIRKYFQDLAKVLPFTEVDVPASQIAQYERYQKEKECDSKEMDVSFLLKKQKSTWFQEVDNNHKAFYGAVNDPSKLKQLILKQMDLYTQVLKDLP